VPKAPKEPKEPNNPVPKVPKAPKVRKGPNNPEPEAEAAPFVAVYSETLEDDVPMKRKKGIRGLEVDMANLCV
jgi:hypothetical protein